MTSTIPALKRNFLNSQVRILNTPLEPPEDWRETGPVPEEGDLDDKVVEDVVRKGDSTTPSLKTTHQVSSLSFFLPSIKVTEGI